MVEKLVIKAAPPTGTFDLAAAIASKPLLTPLVSSDEFVVRRPASNALFRVTPATIASYVGVSPSIPPTSMYKNVKDFGAIGDWNNSTGADDTAAIQAAVNSVAGRGRGTIFFPLGTYRVTAPITFHPALMDIAFVGAPGATLYGNFNGFILDRVPANLTGGVRIIEGLTIYNYHATGGAIRLQGCVGASISNCYINAYQGIHCFFSQSVSIDACTIISPGASSTSVGIMAGNATSVRSTDITGYNHGIRHHNLGLIVQGGRMEVNHHAILLGRDENGNDYASNGVDISGVSMESNSGSGIFLAHASGVRIASTAITVNVPEGAECGLYLGTGSSIVVEDVIIASPYAFEFGGVEFLNVDHTVLIGVWVSAPGTAWTMPSNASGIDFIGCSPVPDHEITFAQLPTLAPQGTIRFVSNSNTATLGAKITTTGANRVVAMKILGSNVWIVIGVSV